LKVYFAGVEPYLLNTVFAGANVLLSFRYIAQARDARLPSCNAASIMLDSGALSAYRSGVAVDLCSYCDFLLANREAIDLYVNLDVIGDAQATLANQRYMEQRGLSPMPVFHFDEDFDLLEYYCDNYELVGLGGMVPRSYKRMRAWLEAIFARRPHKYHGFGIGDIRLITSFPFFSIDNTTWRRVVQQPVLRTKTNSGINWASYLCREELFQISRKFYERLCESL